MLYEDLSMRLSINHCIGDMNMTVLTLFGSSPGCKIVRCKFFRASAMLVEAD